MSQPVTKIDPNKNEYYVLRKGKKPGIYFSYNEGLQHKHDWDERPVIRKFKNWCEACYYFETGKDIPPPPMQSESNGRALF